MNDKNTMKRIEKIFPDYFQRFKLPDGAREESIMVYRACRSGKCDKNSFLPSFEENAYIPVTYKVTLGEIVDLLQLFKDNVNSELLKCIFCSAGFELQTY